MPSLSITWHSMQDKRVCPVCEAADGYTWTFHTGQDELTGQLVHPKYGVIWDLSRGSLAHEHHGAGLGGFPAQCRCHITYAIDPLDIVAKIKQITATLRNAVEAKKVEMY